MRYTVPHYYNKFKCTAGACQDTCCAGWAIMIDEVSLKKYKNMKGPFGNRMLNSIRWKEGSFKQYGHRCAFLNEENLCDIYTEAGPSMLCTTCRNYPRHIEEFEGIREISLSLSCMEAAKLILGCEEPVRFISKEKAGEEAYEDFDFLLYTKLTDARDIMITFMQKREIDIRTRVGLCLGLAHDIQTRIDRGQLFQVDSVLRRCQQDSVLNRCENKLLKLAVSPEERYEKMISLLSGLSRLECLNDTWPEYLESLKRVLYERGTIAYAEAYQRFQNYCSTNEDIKWETWEEQLMVYFIFTYFSGAVYDEHALAKLKLAAVSTLAVQELFMGIWLVHKEKADSSDMIEIAHRYSREIEHSDDNLNLLEEMFLEEGSYGFEELLTLVMS